MKYRVNHLSKLFYLILICLIIVSCNQNSSKTLSIPKEKLTFTEHIAPILYRNCVVCHRSDGIAPFSLITYQDVWRKKKTIVRVTKSGFMPPWPADPNFSHFIGEKILTPEEKLMIQYWVEAGAKEGPKDKLPKKPEFPSGSSLGTPDLTLFIDSVVLEPHGQDRFLTIKIPFKIPHDTFVRAVEFIPGKGNYVHHMNGHLLNYKQSEKKDVFAGRRVADLQQNDYDQQFLDLGLLNDNGTEPERVHSAVNYLPGVYPVLYPEGIGGFRISQIGAFVANDMHYAPVHKKVTDRSRINVFYAKKPPTRPTFELMLGTNGQSAIEPPLVIPPNKVMTFRTKGVVPEDISILTINPHMHLLGKTFKAFGLTAAGDTIKLISIPRWDFRWQYFYTFRNPVKLPKGTVIIVEGVFDNTESNPNNPNHPPRTVSDENKSMKTSDEMFQFIITWMPYKPGDENIELGK